MHRELATSRSQVRRHNHYTTEPYVIQNVYRICLFIASDAHCRRDMQRSHYLSLRTKLTKYSTASQSTDCGKCLKVKENSPPPSSLPLLAAMRPCMPRNSVSLIYRWVLGRCEPQLAPIYSYGYLILNFQKIATTCGVITSTMF